MADPKRVAAALSYQQQRQPDWWDAVPVADAPGTVRAPTQPEQSWLDKAYALAEGAGMGLAKQAAGVGNLLFDPIGSAKQMYESGRAVAQDPALLVRGLQAMGEKAVSGPQGFGEVVGENINPRNLVRNLATPNVREITAYHGTPHTFPATERNPLGEFDSSKIGTGEGAQAYGHGLYLAETPDVAKNYQLANSKDTFITQTGYFDPSELEHMNVRVQTRKNGLDAGIEHARKFSAPDSDYPEVAAKAARDLEKLESIKAAGGMRKNEGSLYHVDLPDPMIEKMLDWDKPWDKQPQFVKDAIKSSGLFKQYKENLSDFSTPMLSRNRKMRGENIHAFVEHLAGGDQAKASEKLRELGIPGIKYLDAGSRGAATGTRNFVIFPGEESNLKILERK